MTDQTNALPPEYIGIPEAAQMLGWTWHRTYNAVLANKMDGHKDDGGRWRVLATSVERFRAGLASD